MWFYLNIIDNSKLLINMLTKEKALKNVENIVLFLIIFD